MSRFFHPTDHLDEWCLGEALSRQPPVQAIFLVRYYNTDIARNISIMGES